MSLLRRKPWVLYPRGSALVFINGIILGVHRRPAHFADTLRSLRRRGCVGPYVSVFLQQDCCYIACDGGRVCRPLLICDAGVPRVTSEHMQVPAGTLIIVGFAMAARQPPPGYERRFGG